MNANTFGINAFVIQPSTEKGKTSNTTSKPFRIIDSVIHDAEQYLNKVEESGGKLFLARQYLDRAIASAAEDSSAAAMAAARTAIMLAKSQLPQSGGTALQQEGDALLLFAEMVTKTSK